MRVTDDARAGGAGTGTRSRAAGTASWCVAPCAATRPLAEALPPAWPGRHAARAFLQVAATNSGAASRFSIRYGGRSGSGPALGPLPLYFQAADLGISLTLKVLFIPMTGRLCMSPPPKARK